MMFDHIIQSRLTPDRLCFQPLIVTRYLRQSRGADALVTYRPILRILRRGGWSVTYPSNCVDTTHL